jgi:hypothetical protein
MALSLKEAVRQALPEECAGASFWETVERELVGAFTGLAAQEGAPGLSYYEETPERTGYYRDLFFALQDEETGSHLYALAFCADVSVWAWTGRAWRRWNSRTSPRTGSASTRSSCACDQAPTPERRPARSTLSLSKAVPEPHPARRPGPVGRRDPSAERPPPSAPCPSLPPRLLLRAIAPPSRLRERDSR